MKKLMAILISLSLLALVTGCSPTSDTIPAITPDSDQAQGTETPSGTGPTEGPESIKGPDSPPPSVTEANAEEAAEIERTHQVVETSYTDAEGVHKITLTFNIDKDTVKGIMLQPAFTEEPEKSYSNELAKQAVFKKLEEIRINPVPNVPEFSEAYIKAFEKAVQMYRKKNPS